MTEQAEIAAAMLAPLGVFGCAALAVAPVWAGGYGLTAERPQDIQRCHT